MGALFVMGMLFFLSLLAAVILFKFFKSSAIIKNKKYQAGGAIAGFIIIFVTLYTSYDHIEKRGYETLKEQHKELKNAYDQLSKTLPIRGKIDPYKGEQTRILITTKEFNPDSNGRFKFEVPCIDKKDGAFIYVVREGKGTISKVIFEEDNTEDLTIPILDNR